MSIFFVDAAKTLMMPIDEKHKRIIEARADVYGISYPQMVSVLEDVQSQLKLPINTTVTVEQDREVTLDAFWRIPVQPWIWDPLGLEADVRLKEVADVICTRFDADFEKVAAPNIHLVWCSYLLKNWDYEKCGTIDLQRNARGDFLGGEGNHRRLVLAVGYLSGQLPHILLKAFVPSLRIDAIDLDALLIYTEGISQKTIHQWIEGG